MASGLPLYLVLDDYHLIETPAILEGLAILGVKDNQGNFIPRCGIFPISK